MVNNKEKNFISIVIYVHNNEKIIADFLKKINVQFAENFSNYEIICVNDNSTDSSVLEIRRVISNIEKTVISIINMSRYQGTEIAMNAGVDLAIGDFIFEFDNINIDYNLDIIMQVYNKALNGFDIVSAQPNKKKRFTSKIFYRILNKNADFMYNINTESFRILSRRAINRIKSMNITIPYRKAVYANCGLKSDVLEYKLLKQTYSKLPKEIRKTRKETAINSIVLFTDVAYKFAIIMSIIMMLLTVGIGIYTVYVFLCKSAIEGWTTIMLLLSISFFGIFAILTIMIKYLSIIINLIFKKQKYLIESIEKITK